MALNTTNVVIVLLAAFILYHMYTDHRSRSLPKAGRRAIRRTRQNGEELLLNEALPLSYVEGSVEPTLLSGAYPEEALLNTAVINPAVINPGGVVEVDEFKANKTPVYHPVTGEVHEGPAKEWDTYVKKPVKVGHHGLPVTVTEHKNVTVPVQHPAVPYEKKVAVPVTVMVPQPPIKKIEYKEETVTVPGAPFTKKVQRPYTYYVDSAPIRKEHTVAIPKVHPGETYVETVERPVSFTVQPPDYKTTEVKKVPVHHPATTYFTEETVLKPMRIRVPHVKPGFTTTRLEHYEKLHHQAPITTTKVEKFQVPKFKPPFVTTEMKTFTQEIIPPKQAKIGYKEETEVIQPPPHTEIRKEPYEVVIPQPAVPETKIVDTTVTAYHPPYTTYKTEVVEEKKVIPGKDYVTEEYELERVHHKLQEEQQVVAESQPVGYLGPAVGVPQFYENDYADYARTCATGAECPNGACGLQYSSQHNGDVRVCCPSGRVNANGRCEPVYGGRNVRVLKRTIKRRA